MADAPSKSHARLAIGPAVRPRELLTDRPQLKSAWTAKVITLLPEAYPGVLGHSLTGKALKDGLWRVDAIDLRVFGDGKHRNVDDTPSGGGAGMVLRADVMEKAIKFATKDTPSDRQRWPLIYLSPRGKPFSQERARQLASAEGVTLISGRFEGLDERVIEEFDLEEVSIGDFVMTGGEIAAQAVIDATVRLLPGVLGNSDSTEEESFSRGLLEHPQYTRPAEWRGRAIPAVLTSGDHGKVETWRRDMAERITRARRPDLWKRYKASEDDAES